MRKTNQKGFTIIELLVVIVIIGILVALALPQLFAAQKRGRDTDRKNDLKNIQQKLETAFNDNDAYPSNAESIDGVSLDGPRNSRYTYTPRPNGCTNDCQEYTLSAELENKSDKDAANGVYTVESVNKVEATTPTP